MGHWPVAVYLPAANTTALGHALRNLRALVVEAETPEAARQVAGILVSALVEKAERP